VAVFQRVQADIGDEQSLQQSLSTFSGHLTRIVRMLGPADSCSLVLLDELGAGTDPQEGAALGRALLAYLQERGAYVIATSHYPELKAYAQLTARVENASVEFDVERLAPTYRLMVGMPGRSNAFAIAERLGLPGEILTAARAHLAPQSAEAEALLGEIAREREEAEDARRRALKEAAEAATLKHRARAEYRQAERERRELWEQAKSQADEQLAELRREALRLRQQLQAQGVRSETRETVEAALRLPGLKAPPQAAPRIAEESVPAELAELRPGAEVVVPRLGLPGRVLAVRDGDVELEVLGRRVRLSSQELEGATRPTAAERRAARPEPTITLSTPRGDVSYQLDLRGLRRDEALERLQEYLEEASLAGLSQARIVHGKGTGAIRQAVRDALRTSDYVARFQPEPDSAGGDGATLVWLT
jgi:DNA mismatch repair protein MutS2